MRRDCGNDSIVSDLHYQNQEYEISKRGRFRSERHEAENDRLELDVIPYQNQKYPIFRKEVRT